MRASIVIFLILVGSCSGREPDRLVQDLDNLAEEARKAWNVPGCAVVVLRDGKAILSRGYGVKEAGKDDPITPTTIFGIGSLTKAFAATAIAKLVEEDKLRWDDPVRKHVSYFRLKDELADREVTLRDLVSHRTGLARHDILWNGTPWTLEETVRRMAHLEPAVSFRSEFLYNNLAYIATGVAITSASGMPWQDYVRKKLLDPLDMKGVVFTRSEALKAADHAMPHRGDDSTKPAVIAWFDDDKKIRASGSVKTSVRDLERWLRFHLGEGTVDGKEIVSRVELRETYRPQMVTPILSLLADEAETTQASYALGWRVRDHRGRLVHEHGGSVDGFRAHILIAPKEKIGIVVLANLGLTNLPPMLVYSLLDRTLGLPAKDWNAFGLAQARRLRESDRKRDEAWKATRVTGTKPSLGLEAYSGEYEHPAYGTATLRLKDAVLELEWGRYKALMAHFHYDTFTLKGEARFVDETATFVLGAEGEVTRLRLFDQEFKRK
jgi:CubicO group peptidase (beta-lactamase class C family)